MKRILLFLITICLVLLPTLVACNNNDEPPYCPPADDGGTTGRTAYFYNGSKTETLAIAEGATSLILPQAPSMPGKIFIGWAYNGGDGEHLYAAGAMVDLPDAASVEFTAIGVSLYTNVAATASLTEEKLIFSATLGGEDYRRLVSLLGSESVTTGILIAPYKNVTGGNRTFTLDCGAEGLLNRTVQLTNTATDENYIISGETDTIAAEDILEKYAARGYLIYTFAGETHTVYAPYYPLSHTATLHAASAAAFEDLSAVADSRYTRAITTAAGNYYTYHTEAERALLKSRLDRVVSVDIIPQNGAILNEYSFNNIDGYFETFLHYRSPYRVDRVLTDTPENGYKTYVITAQSGADFNTVMAYFVGRSYRAPDRAAEWQADGIYIAVLFSVE